MCVCVCVNLSALQEPVKLLGVNALGFHPRVTPPGWWLAWLAGHPMTNIQGEELKISSSRAFKILSKGEFSYFLS